MVICSCIILLIFTTMYNSNDFIHEIINFFKEKHSAKITLFSEARDLRGLHNSFFEYIKENKPTDLFNIRKY